MRDPDDQSEEEIDAWLAGTLPPERRVLFEQQLAAPAAEEDSDLLQDLDLGRPGADPVLSGLIETLKTTPPEGGAPSEEEGWGGVLEPAGDPGLAGKLGAYEVLETIATGGMGVVLRARDPQLHREVAIKVLSPDLAANATARERFLREARAAAKLEHENILPIYGVHETKGVPYFAMRLATGGTLQDAIDRGEEFGIGRLRAIASGAARALGAAHEKGIVHRDIKPANILFDAGRDHVWVCDFGIARSTEDPGLTYSGAVAGTPRYMSPEQANGDELDGRSDLFSLGAVLYRCASGRQAFAGETTASILKSVVADDPEFSMLDTPPWFTELLARLLAKDPDGRPRDAAAVLASIPESGPREAGHARPRKRTAALWAGVAGIALVGAVAVVPKLSEPAASPTHDPPATATGGVTLEDTGEQFADLYTAFSECPDGSTLLLRGRFVLGATVTGAAGKAIHLRAAEGARPEIVSTDPERHGVFVSGTSTVSGIRFFRAEASERALPIIGFDARGGEILIEDCEFESPHATNPSNGHGALGVAGFGSATIRRCSFRVPGGHCILSGGNRGRLAIEDSVLIGTAAIEHGSAEPGDRCELTIDRCVLFCADAIVRDPRQGFTPLHVSMSDSISHVLRSGFSLADVEADDLRHLVRWRGRNNVYQGNRPIVRTYRALAGPGFAAITINDDAALAEHFPGPGMHDDVGYTFFPRGPFDTAGLEFAEATAADLLHRLRAGVGSPAVEALERTAGAAASR